MSNVNIEINNCNCIKKAKISIQTNTINIKYGANGCGKSTIGKAILFSSNDNQMELNELKPYNDEELPSISDNVFKKVKVFDENYVNKYLFEPKSFLDNSYQVFLRDESFDKLEKATDNLLKELQNIFAESEDIKTILDFLPKYFSITSYKDGNVTKRGGMGELLKGNGSGFSNYTELDSYKPFFQNRDFVSVSKWAKWRNDGIGQMTGDNCPFCTHIMNKEIITKQNDIIGKVFKSSALKIANDVLIFLQEGVAKGYVDLASISILKGYIGNKSKSEELFAELNQLGTETEYLFNKIEKIFQFRPMNISREDLEKIDDMLGSMIIDKRQISKFYSTVLITNLIDEIDNKINNLKGKTNAIRHLFSECQKKMEELIENRKEDINHFFAIAGFPYKFVLKSDGENKALSYLVPINATENEKIEKPEMHLSWGEKNAFSLVMFMFEAISENPDLIVLDDPITSFDKDKKFAIIRRLFDNSKFSFRNQTVLMLTHDLQPVIDYVYGNFLRKYDIHTPVNAAYLTNNNGEIFEQEINKKDLMNVVELTKKIAKDATREMVVRIVNLRKYLELTDPEYVSNSAYDVLSNIIHGRNYENYLVYQSIQEEKSLVIQNGMNFINKFIKEISYDDLINFTNDDKLKDIIQNNKDKYTKIIAIRFLFEKERKNKNLLSLLKKDYPSVCKFVNETNHIENDYILQLNPMIFFEIPDYYLLQLEKFINDNVIYE